jgi:uncharacterized protein (UPF0333 family)
MKNKFETYQQKKGYWPAQALVEYALVLPILLLLVIGAMDFGRMFYTKMVLINASREGASYLSYNPDDADEGFLETFAIIYNEGFSSNVEVFASDVTYTGCCTRGFPVEVSITKTVELIFDGILQNFGLLGGPVQLTSSVKMVVQ